MAFEQHLSAFGQRLTAIEQGAASSEDIRFLQQQLSRVKLDLYFSALESTKGDRSSKIVDLKVPDSNIVYAFRGPSADRSIIAQLEYGQGLYEPHVVRALKKYLPATATCIDVGANLGAISLQLSSIVHKGAVYSFEPGEQNFRYLSENVTHNGIENVHPVKLGAADVNDTFELNYIPDLAGCSFVSADGVVPAEASGAVKEAIHCVTLDSWVKSNNVPPVDFLKVDAEGMEEAVLRGAAELLSRDRPEMVIEFNPHTSDGMGHGSSRGLFDALAACWDRIYLIPRDFSGALVPVDSFDHLMRLVALGGGWEDLYCTSEYREGLRSNAPAG